MECVFGPIHDYEKLLQFIGILFSSFVEIIRRTEIFISETMIEGGLEREAVEWMRE